MNNKYVSSLLHNVALYLDLIEDNPFKTKAYYNASITISRMDEDIVQLSKNNNLRSIKGIGDALQKAIIEIVETGTLKYLEELASKIPVGIIDMLDIPNLGPKKVKVLYNELNISSIKELEYACLENRLTNLKGFGKKTQDNIIEGIRIINQNKNKYLLATALEVSEVICQSFIESTFIDKYSLVGSLRRRSEIVNDIDILVTCNNYDAFLSWLENSDYFSEVVSKSSDVLKIKTKFGVSLDIIIVKEDEYYIALHSLTGNIDYINEFNNLLTDRKAILGKSSLKIENDTHQISCEEDIYKYLNIQYIQPELREYNTVINQAVQHQLPELVTIEDIKGALHNHSTWSDGEYSIKEMRDYAEKLGWEYIGIADHSKAAFYANGLDEKRIIQQMKEIDGLNIIPSKTRILKGIEVDILTDGELDLSNEILSMCDYVIASVHNQFKLTEEKMTTRILKAIENPYVTMIGHPTGRILLGREEYALNMDAFLQANKQFNKIIELNSNPNRLDVDWRNLIKAYQLGLKVCINPDAHSIRGLHDVKYGVMIARKGWTSKENCINTFSLDKFVSYTKKS